MLAPRHACLMGETNSDSETKQCMGETISLTPSLKRRVRECASERDWTVVGTIRYFFEIGLAVEVVRPPEGP